jgi:hypothetical protein
VGLYMLERMARSGLVVRVDEPMSAEKKRETGQ